MKNFINHKKVLSVVDTAGNMPAPIKRAIINGKKMGIVIDITTGRGTNSAIFMEDGYIILSNVSGPTMAKRIEEARNVSSAKEKVSG